MAKKNLLSNILDDEPEVIASGSSGSGDNPPSGTSNTPKTTIEVVPVVLAAAAENTDAKSEPSKEIKKGIIEKPEKPSEKVESIKETGTTGTVSKTFYIHDSEFKTIEDFVAFKRMEGDLRFPAKLALKEAFDLLRNVEKKGIKLDPITFDPEDKCSNHSFNILKSDFDFINEVYRNRRLQGKTKYTQADALSEALSLLKSKYPNI